MGGQAGENVLRRDAPPVGNCARIGARAEAVLPRRTDDRPGPRFARCRREMLSRLKRERDLTILVTTHYMDEADKLCDRIAIVDHGKLVAPDSPLKLKASIRANCPGSEFFGRSAKLDGDVAVPARMWPRSKRMAIFTESLPTTAQQYDE